MTTKILIPVSSQNFNAIFSSESISPSDFYAKRNFGISRFEKIFEEQNDELIHFYTKLPSIQTDPNSDYETYILLIEFYISEQNIYQFNNDIWYSNETIYLNTENFKVFFKSDYEKKVVLTEAKLSTSTKLLEKYKNQFIVSKEKFNTNFLLPDIFPSLKNEKLRQFIEADRIFNSFKGLTYAFLIGNITKSSVIENRFFQLLQEFINVFAQIKNEITSNAIGKYQQNATEILKTLKKLFENISGKDDFNFHEYAKLNYNQEFSSDFQRSYFFRDIIKLLKTDYISKTDNPYFLFDELIQILKQIKSYSYSVEKMSKIDNYIKDSLFKIEKHIKAKCLDNTKNINISKDLSFILNAEDQEIQYLDNTDFIAVLNIIFRNRKNYTGKTRDEDLIHIVIKIGEYFRFIKKDNRQAENLLNVYYYLSHEKSNLDFEKFDYLVKNIIAFFLNPNSIDNLKKYAIDKKIRDNWFSFMFWGAYNGFANMSSKFCEPIFKQQSQNTLKQIDIFLSNTYNSLRKIDHSNYVIPEIVTPELKKQFKIKQDYSQTKNIGANKGVKLSLLSIIKRFNESKRKMVNDLLKKIPNNIKQFEKELKKKNSNNRRKQENKLNEKEFSELLKLYDEKKEGV